VLLLAASPVFAGTVRGVLVDKRGRPDPDQVLRFENRVSGDIYLVKTRRDGVFAAQLPPGTYYLRNSQGRPLLTGIACDKSSLDLGTVSEPARPSLWDFFHSQSMGEALVKSPAPSAANVP
jgi:hypothetical protein